MECVKNPDGSRVPYLGATPNPEGGAPCVALLPKTNYVNSPGEIKGGELELDFRPIDNLLDDHGLDRLHELLCVELDATGGITFNGQPVYVPEWNGAASIAYTINLAGGGTISPRYDAYLQTQICSPSRRRRPAPAGYTLHNARIEWASPPRNVVHRGWHQQPDGPGVPAEHLRPHALRRGDDGRSAGRTARVVRHVPAQFRAQRRPARSRPQVRAEARSSIGARLHLLGAAECRTPPTRRGEEPCAELGRCTSHRGDSL